MGRRGPAPKPKKLKIAGGNPGGRPLNKNEPAPPPGAPEMPAMLDDRARGVWAQIVPRLARIGLASTVDGESLGRYCTLVVLWRDCVAFIETHGRSYAVRAEGEKGKPGRILRFVQFPESSMLLRIASELRQIEDRFGLTPSARSRINVEAEKATQGDTGDLKRKFLLVGGPPPGPPPRGQAAG